MHTRLPATDKDLADTRGQSIRHELLVAPPTPHARGPCVTRDQRHHKANRTRGPISDQTQISEKPISESQNLRISESQKHKGKHAHRGSIGGPSGVHRGSIGRSVSKVSRYQKNLISESTHTKPNTRTSRHRQLQTHRQTNLVPPPTEHPVI